jgi:hypothetical protein
MRTRAIIHPMPSNSNDDRETAHRIPGALATATIIDVVTTADLMQQAVYEGHPREEVERLREIARAQFEAYLDLMVQSANHVRALRP